MRHAAILCVVALLSGLPVSAQVPAGGEFQVSIYTHGWSAPGIACDATGRLVVVWDGPTIDGNGFGVAARRFDATGVALGPEFQVNTFTTGTQAWPVVASDPAGNFVIAWTSDLQDGSEGGVFAQRFHASGARRGAEFPVNTHTTSYQGQPTIAANAAGGFVVAWQSAFQDGDSWGIFGQRYDASGARQGDEFQANAHSLFWQVDPFVMSDPAGNFVVAWSGWFADSSSYGVDARRFDASGQPGPQFQINGYGNGTQSQASLASSRAGDFVAAWSSEHQDGSSFGIFARRYDASARPQGAEFRVNTYTTGAQGGPSVASDAAGDFVVAWESVRQDGGMSGVFAQRFDASGAPRGTEFRVNTYTTGLHVEPQVASDPVGNFTVAWYSGQTSAIVARRFGGIVPTVLQVDTAPSAGSDGDGILEAGESVDVRPCWRNVNGAAQTFDATGLGFTGPAASGVRYQLEDGAGTYGTVANGATVQCTDCYRVGVAWTGTRPSVHWDATFTERLTPDALGQTKLWPLHVAESFTDVPKSSFYYRDIETLLHEGVTGGCAATQYCPGDPVTREQMAVFTLEAREGAGYRPPACGSTPMFPDVPASSFFCGWIEELARRGVVGGCGGGNYCPGAAVAREQMPVFVLRLLDPTLDPPACTVPRFADVPASSPYCRWIEELARRGVVGGCGGGNYCPMAPVTREQMATFITGTYGLTLYGP